MGGCAPHAPIPEERALRGALAHPPALGGFLCGGCAPTPPLGWRRTHIAEGERESCVGLSGSGMRGGLSAFVTSVQPRWSGEPPHPLPLPQERGPEVEL